MQTLWQDLRYGVRMLLKKPSFTLIAVLTLALGIGANTAIFGLVDKLIMQSLPVKDPAALVLVQAESVNPRLTYSDYSWADYRDYRAQSQVLSDLTAFEQQPVNFGSGDQMERVRAELVSDNYFSLLGAQPILGRTFSLEENQTPGAHPVAVLSSSLWQSRFGGNPQVLGRTAMLNEMNYTIVGVMPPNFRGMTIETPTDIWVPAMMRSQIAQMPADDKWSSEREHGFFKLVGRLKPGVTKEAAQTAMDTLALQVRDSWMPESDRNLPFNERGVQLAPAGKGLSSLRSEMGKPLKLLFAIVGLILLIACANVANLLLARSVMRRKEIAVRNEMAAGVLNHSVNWRVALFTLLASLVTGLLFGIIPTLQAAKLDLVPALKDDGTLPRDGKGFKVSRHALIVSQVALSVVVLVCTGLFLRSLSKLLAIDPGFNPDNVLVAELELPMSKYNKDRSEIFYQQLLERLKALPDVESVAAAHFTPLSGTVGLTTVVVEGQSVRPDKMPTVDTNTVGSGYHELMSIRLLEGRGFTEQDRKGATGVAIVNEAFARRFFPDGKALGKRVSQGVGMPLMEIVGVTRNIKSLSLFGKDRPQLDLPIDQQGPGNSLRVLIRAKQEAASLLPSVRREVRAMDLALAFFKTSTLKDDLRNSIAAPRMAATLLGLFGVVALALAAIGLYGISASTR